MICWAWYWLQQKLISLNLNCEWNFISKTSPCSASPRAGAQGAMSWRARWCLASWTRRSHPCWMFSKTWRAFSKDMAIVVSAMSRFLISSAMGRSLLNAFHGKHLAEVAEISFWRDKISVTVHTEADLHKTNTKPDNTPAIRDFNSDWYRQTAYSQATWKPN